MPKFTDRTISALRPQPGKRITVFDTIVPGLAVRVGERGAKSFVLITRLHGRQRWITIGPVGAVRLAQAREEARDALALVRRGIDPTPVAASVRPPDLFTMIAPRFIEEYARPRNRSWRETGRIFHVYVLPAWGGRDIGTITRRDVRELLETVARDHGGVQSNRTLSAVRKLFAWALERDIVPANPAAGVHPVAKEVSRDRVLSENELHAFWQASGELTEPWSSFFRVLALTGQRLGEVAGMRWEDIDLDRGAWTLPASHNKSGRPHEVPLVPRTVRILRAIPRRSGPLVFATGTGDKPISGFGGPRKALAESMPPCPRWTPHDLRRTFATTAARLGVAPHAIERVLGHSGGVVRGVAAVYNRCAFDNEKRRALELWARHLTAEKASTMIALR